MAKGRGEAVVPAAAEGMQVELYGGRAAGVVVRAADNETGNVTTYVRRVDFLEDLLRNDRITEDQYWAAQDFRANFRTAGGGERFKTIFDITNTSARGNNGVDPLSGGADARKYVAVSMNALGTKMGDAVWYIIGLEWSLNHYVQQKRLAGRPITRDVAAGLIEGALEILVSVHAVGNRRTRIQAVHDQA